MRLLFLTRSLSGGGAEKVTATLANYCSRMGHDVHVLTYARSDSDYSLDRSVFIHDHSCIFELRRPQALKKLFSDLRPNALVSLGSKYNYIALSRILGTGKVILSERNDPERFYKSRIHRKFVLWCYRRAAGVVFQTNYAKEYFDLKGCAEVVPNPVADPRVRWNESSHEKTIINFCRLEPQKNLSLLIEAFAIFSETHPEYRLKIYGEGSLRGGLEALIKKLELDNRVLLLPFCNDIHTEVAKAELFVSSSDYEGMSNSLLEAILIGIPVVSTDCGGGSAREILGDFPSVCLVDRGSIDQLVKSLETITTNSNLRLNISEIESRTALRYRPEVVTKKWLHFIEGAVD